MNKYYLYIDDSGKFKNKQDNHIVYSFVVFNKNGRKKFSSLSARWKKELPPPQAKEIKGDKFIERLNKWKRSPKKKIPYELMIGCYDNAIVTGSVIWCKKLSLYETTNITNEQEQIKKIRMISIILKFLRLKGYIPNRSEIKIYMDREKKHLYEEKPGLIKSILNENYSEFSGDIRYLRVNNIQVSEIKYLDSKDSLGIQWSDVLANATYKVLSGEKSVKFFFSLFDLYAKSFYCIFPGYKYGTFVSSLHCDCENRDVNFASPTGEL